MKKLYAALFVFFSLHTSCFPVPPIAIHDELPELQELCDAISLPECYELLKQLKTTYLLDDNADLREALWNLVKLFMVIASSYTCYTTQFIIESPSKRFGDDSHAKWFAQSPEEASKPKYPEYYKTLDTNTSHEPFALFKAFITAIGFATSSEIPAKTLKDALAISYHFKHSKSSAKNKSLSSDKAFRQLKEYSKHVPIQEIKKIIFCLENKIDLASVSLISLTLSFCMLYLLLHQGKVFNTQNFCMALGFLHVPNVIKHNYHHDLKTVYSALKKRIPHKKQQAAS